MLTDTKTPYLFLNFNLANAYAAIADVNTVSAVVASPTKIELNIYLANGNAFHALS